MWPPRAVLIWKPCAVHIQCATRNNSILSKVFHFLRAGLPAHTKEAGIKPFWLCQNELMCEGGYMMRGIGVVVPQKLCERVLQELQLSHPGIHRIKLTARSHVWWPCIEILRTWYTHVLHA